MNADEFNNKYKNHLDHGFYGLVIDDKEVVEFLDKEFSKSIEKDSNFRYSQIKLKFGSSRVYTSSDKNNEWEEVIDKILKK